MKSKKYDTSFFIFDGIKLDNRQIKILKSRRKKILVLAGAGSGKTFTIAAKVRYLIEYEKINPKKILCISFTNDSVNSLKNKINNKNVNVMTFHKLALNIIGNKLNASRKTTINKGVFFDKYVEYCKMDLNYEEPEEIKFISSDDVFDYLLDIRAINANVNRRKNTLTKEFLNNKYNSEDFSIEEHEALKDQYDARHKTMSSYIRDRLMNNNIIEQSNGESALMFWEQDIKENGIYILDEPENSLSAENQLKLKQFIEDSARFYNCQFIISTHSPFLLNLNEALIYDLDEIPVRTKKWNELGNVKVYYNFFKENENEFNE